MATGRAGEGWRRLAAPRTRLGCWCLRSFGIGLVGLVLMALAIGSGQRGGETIVDNWWISGPALIAALGLVSAFPIGSIAVIRGHERALPVIVATALAALVTLYLVLEITQPH